MVKSSGITYFFQIPRASAEIPANWPGQFSPYEQIFFFWVTATLKGLVEFQNKKKILSQKCLRF